jgi:hypothetical protein
VRTADSPDGSRVALERRISRFVRSVGKAIYTNVRDDTTARQLRSETIAPAAEGDRVGNYSEGFAGDGP